MARPIHPRRPLPPGRALFGDRRPQYCFHRSTKSAARAYEINSFVRSVRSYRARRNGARLRGFQRQYVHVEETTSSMRLKPRRTAASISANSSRSRKSIRFISRAAIIAPDKERTNLIGCSRTPWRRQPRRARANGFSQQGESVVLIRSVTQGS